MSADTGGKPPSGSSPGRPAADTPQRVVVRSLDQQADSALGASDTAVAMAADRVSVTQMAVGPSDGGTSSIELIGTTLSGRYLVTRKVGQGGMGAVYEATHTLIGKRVAVKVLLEKYAQRTQIVQRLEQEAKLASSVGNEHIIDITDFGTTEDGRTFVVMEFLEGESLAECLSRETHLPEQRILRIASQTASALAAAHAKGVVHRDIKPENLFLLKRRDQDFVKVVDFGISKSLRASSEEEQQPRLTQTGMVLGTPLYMSPEQARGDEDLDHRVDIYALGVIMYELAAGRVPYAGNNYLSVISQVLNEEPTPVREIRPEISEEFDAIVARAMAKERTHRYADANEMLKDITAVLEDPTHSTERAKITGPRRRFPKTKIPRAAWAVGGVGVAIAGVTIAVVLLMSSGGTKPLRAAKAPRTDASVAVVVTPDAAPIEPAIKKIKLRIESDPPNAAIFKESEPIGNAPADLELVLKDKEVRITAQLAGYDDGSLMINPEEYRDGQSIPIKLKKPVKGLPPRTTKIKVGGPGNGSAEHSHAGGDFNGYPGDDGSSIPKK